MRILHTSDWHLGRSLEQISRIEEQREFSDWLCKTVDEQRIDLVLVAGDIYDTYNPPAAAEELFYNTINRLSNGGEKAVVVIAGNHDNPERLCAASPLAYKNGIILLGYPASDAGEYWPAGEIENKDPDGLENEGVMDARAHINLIDSGPGWMELCIPGCEHHAVIITMPYPSESRLEKLLSEEADEALLQKAYSEKIGSVFTELGAKFRDDTVNLVIAHLFLLGGGTSDSERTLQVGGAMTVDPGVLPGGAHYAAMGHLHRPQQIKNAGFPVYYAGSPLAYSFSEADYSKAVYIVDAAPGKKAVVTPVYLDCGKPLRRWIADEGIAQAIRWCEEGRDPNAWVDLEIVTDRPFTADEQKNLRSLHKGIINIRPRMKTGEIEILDFTSREGRRMDELFSDYYKYRMGVDIPDELMKAFIEVINEGDTEDGISDSNGGDGTTGNGDSSDGSGNGGDKDDGGKDGGDGK